MTEYRAKHREWCEIEEWAETSESPWDSCILELRSRIEDLEALNYDLRVQLLRMANAIAKQLPDKNKFFADLTPDREEN